jgi:hypothetical protein
VVVFGTLKGDVAQVLEARGDDGNPSKGSLQGNAAATAYTVQKKYDLAYAF